VRLERLVGVQDPVKTLLGKKGSTALNKVLKGWLPLFGVIGLSLLAGCEGITEPDGCGAKNTPRKVFNLADLTLYQLVDASTARASWVISALDVCTLTHADVSYEMRIHALADFEVEALVLYGVNRIRSLPQDFKSEQDLWVFSGDDNFGVKDVYADGPGEWSFMVITQFAHQGSTFADSAFISSNIASGEMKATYKSHKY